MKVRKANKSANSKRRAREVARQDAEIADLKAQLDEARVLINAQAEQIKTLTERMAQLENELAKAKKDSSNSSKPRRVRLDAPWIMFCLDIGIREDTSCWATAVEMRLGICGASRRTLLPIQLDQDADGIAGIYRRVSQRFRAAVEEDKTPGLQVATER